MEIPEGGDSLWAWFWDIDRDRLSFNGPQPIGSTGFKAWSEMTGNVLRPDEVEILRLMDEAYRGAMAVEMREQSERRHDERGRK